MWIDRAAKWLLPRDEHFFELLEGGADRAHEISALLVECCAVRAHADREAIVERMHQVEHEADRIIAEVYEALNRTFVTPLDRSDIYTLERVEKGRFCRIFPDQGSVGSRLPTTVNPYRIVSS
jgi:uncharacterized protein Yka (UPF0111/DUF47 family)